jgi:GNAT superfamily N-acetyltransferase
VKIRPATRHDASALLDLVDGLAAYERLEPPDAAARERLIEDAFGATPRFNVLLAEHDGNAIGYAAWFETYGTFSARSRLYLEDLFVVPTARGLGAGLALFRACAAETLRRGYSRMQWQVLDWNQPSIEFYIAQGAEQSTGWLEYRLAGDALAKAAAASA